MATAEAAERLGVSVSTLHRWRETGRLPAIQKLGGETGAYVFLAADVETLAAEIARELEQRVATLHGEAGAS